MISRLSTLLLVLVALTASGIAQDTVHEPSYFPGTCLQYQHYTAPPGRAGRTEFLVEPDNIVYVISPDAGGFTCSCNQKAYPVITQCVRECKVTLGCFTGICNEVENCAIGTAIASLKLKQDTYTTRWDVPPIDRSVASCMIAANGYFDIVDKHEAGHRAADRQILREWNDNEAHSWVGNIQRCASTEAIARQLVKEAIDQRIDVAASEVTDRMKKEEDRWHHTEEGAGGHINCLLCPGASSEDPPVNPNDKRD